MSGLPFARYPDPVQRALAYRAELGDLGFDLAHVFVAYGVTIVNVPLESGFPPTPPADHTLVTVHLRLPEYPEDFPIACGYLEDRTWPAAPVLAAAMSLWEALPLNERSFVRRRFVSVGESIRLVRTLLERGYVPPKLKAERTPTGRN